MKFIIFLNNWAASWLDMICGLISVITLTLYRPWWDFQYRIWSGKKILKHEKKKKQWM